jgi:very-short-patch-repair endonuclease
MGDSGVQPALWGLVARQHGVVARGQLRALGFSARWIHHRLAKGRLHPVWRSVYAVGRPQLTPYGRWMAATLTCGSTAMLSHDSAAALREIRRGSEAPLEVSVLSAVRPRRRGLVIHRRAELDPDRCRGIPVTRPVCTLIDVAARLPASEIEAAINEADKLGLVSPGQLRRSLDAITRRPGVGRLRSILDRQNFLLTDSELERRFLSLLRSAGLPEPETGRYVNGFKVDFFWPHLGLIVETDGLRYHRTPAQQTRDRRRDQVHAATGLTPLRFTHAQVRYEPAHVVRMLAAVTRL